MKKHKKHLTVGYDILTLCGRFTFDVNNHHDTVKEFMVIEYPENPHNVWYITTRIYEDKYCKVCTRVLHSNRPEL